MNEYLSLTELGRLYGVSSHVVGRWLKGLGLQTQDGRPSPEAFAQSYVTQRPSRQAGTYFWIWHADKTTGILDGMRYPRAEDQSAGQSTSHGGLPVPQERTE